MDTTELFVDAAAANLGLHIAAESRPAVLGYFRLAASMAQLLETVVLTTADESGSVFMPVSPPGQEEAP